MSQALSLLHKVTLGHLHDKHACKGSIKGGPRPDGKDIPGKGAKWEGIPLCFLCSRFQDFVTEERVTLNTEGALARKLLGCLGDRVHLSSAFSRIISLDGDSGFPILFI